MNKAIIADIAQFHLYAADNDIRHYGGASYIEYLEHRRNRKELLGQRVQVALVVLVIGLVMALGVAAWAGYTTKRQKAEKAKHSHAGDADTAVTPEELFRDGRTVWIGPSQYFTRMLQISNIVAVIYIVVTVVLGLLVIRDIGNTKFTYALTGMVMLMAVVPAMAIYLTGRKKKWQLGINGRDIFMRDHNNEIIRSALANIVRTPSSLKIGNKLVTLRTRGNKLLWEEAGFRKYFEPVLQQCTKINEFQMMGRMLKAGDPVHWLTLIAVILVLVLEITDTI
jgi:hypothetical protein